MKITSPHPDLHSGIEGGAVAEPMVDMFVKSHYLVLAKLLIDS